MDSFAFAILMSAMLVLSAPSARAAQDDPRLPALFATLKTASDAEAKAVEAMIWRIWTETRDADDARLMRQGIAALNGDEAAGAFEAFDALVHRDERFAEGWNKRATVEFVMGDFEASVADIQRTLALEPRHFGALSGLGQIYVALHRNELALKAFQAALAINPHLGGVRAAIEELKKDVEGEPI